MGMCHTLKGLTTFCWVCFRSLFYFFSFFLTHLFCCVVTGFRLTPIGGYLSGSITSNHSWMPIMLPVRKSLDIRLVLTRCILFLTVAFAFNTLGNAGVNLLAVTSAIAGLTILSWLCNGVYEQIRIYFILNLCIFAVSTYHVNISGGHQALLSNSKCRNCLYHVCRHSGLSCLLKSL